MGAGEHVTMALFRSMARGRTEETPMLALGAVFLVVFAVVALVAAAAMLIYLLG